MLTGYGSVLLILSSLKKRRCPDSVHAGVDWSESVRKPLYFVTPCYASPGTEGTEFPGTFQWERFPGFQFSPVDALVMVNVMQSLKNSIATTS
ncbi:MAG: hypothetical protein HGA97_04115 [Chlorobiaceae bacterium]|jgi:hypothetical protein|nr:hypothetical protein [Chlorobiaceae bacterium]